jgi:DNA-binding MarR family transcriptional regulator
MNYVSSMQRDPRSSPAGRPPGEGGVGSVAFLLAQVGAHAATRFAERLAPLKLAPQHAGVLRLVGATAGLSQRALAERLGVLPSRLVLLVDDLEARGLVERRDDPDDRRSYALHLTGPGRATLAELGRVAREHGESLCAALSADERRQLAALLARIAGEQGLTPGVHPGYKDRP